MSNLDISQSTRKANRQRVWKSNDQDGSRLKTHFIHQIKSEALESALQIQKNSSLLLKSIDPKSGHIKIEMTWGGKQNQLRIQVDEKGRFCPDKIFPIEVSLAALIMIFCEPKGKFQLEGHLRPDWMTDDFRLTIQVIGPSVSFNSSLKITNLNELQSYWTLMDLGRQKKSPLDPDLLALFILKNFSYQRWEIQRAAFDAILERLQSAKSEKLGLLPHSEGFLHTHHVFRQSKKNILPYEVTFSPSYPLVGSCTCKDFLKSQLGLCKHLASGLLQFKSVKNEKPLPRIFWQPKLGHSDKSLESRNRPSHSKSETPVSLINEIFAGGFARTPKGLEFFEWNKVPSPMKAGALKSPNSRIEFLKILSKNLKRNRKSVLVDSAIFPLIEEEIRSLHWANEFESHRKKLLSSMNQLEVTLFPYQKEGVSKALQSGRFIIADEMGLGKTVQGIAWGEALIKSKLVSRILIVCPNALKFQWQREWAKTSKRIIQIVEGAPEQRTQFYQMKEAVLVVNYEVLLRDLPQVLNFAPDAVILDEAQRIKNYATKTSQNVKKLNSKFRLILTGTPMENRLQEIASLVDWVNLRAMPPLWSLDAKMSIKSSDSKSPVGVRGLNELRSALSPHLIRRRRTEVLTQLPKRTDAPIYLNMTDEQREIHESLANRVARLVGILGNRPLTHAEHLQLMQLLNQMRIVCNGLAQFNFEQTWNSLKDDVHRESRLPGLFSPKLVEFRNLIEGLLSQNVKVVIFSQWKRMLRLAHWSVEDLMKKNKVESVFFTGDESTKKRMENIVRFHDEPNVRFFFSTDAGGVGLNLQKAASVCINLEMPWNPAVLEQRNSRVYRLGQTQPVQIFNLVTLDSIEERIQNLVGKKKAVFSGLFDGTSDEIRFESGSGFYQQIQEIVKENVEVSMEEDEANFKQELSEETEMDVRGDFSSDEVSTEGVSVQATHSSGQNQKMEQKDNQVQKSVPPHAFNLREVMKDLQITRDRDTLKIEAKGDSARLLADVFRGMADLFSPLDSRDT